MKEPLRAAVFGAAFCIMVGCSGKPEKVGAVAGEGTPSASAPSPAPDIEQIAALATASSDCSLKYFQSIDFNPSQQQAVMQRGKFGELVADVNSVPVVAERAASEIQLIGSSDPSRQAESYIMNLRTAPWMNGVSRHDQVRAIAYDAYYEAMGARADCAPDPRVLQFIGKAAP